MILALDATNNPHDPDRTIEADDARRIVGELDDLVSFVKVGWALYMAGGNQVVRELVDQGKRVFLDLKFGDIDETVRRLVLVAIQQGVSFITLNAGFGAVRAAVKARGNTQLKILLVTMLTSWNEADLAEMGFTLSASEYVSFRTKGAIEAGCDGVIASGREVAEIRRIAPSGFFVVTPGIRPVGGAHDDHKRAVTPAASIFAGSDYLVVGRPITTAPDPRQATIAILQEMQQAFDARSRPAP